MEAVVEAVVGEEAVRLEGLVGSVEVRGGNGCRGRFVYDTMVCSFSFPSFSYSYSYLYMYREKFEIQV